MRTVKNNYRRIRNRYQKLKINGKKKSLEGEDKVEIKAKQQKKRRETIRGSLQQALHHTIKVYKF